MILVLSGVAGAGKSTIGSRLADRLGWPYLEADEFHSAANVEKMDRGVALTEEDRGPWLESMAAAIRTVGDDAVVSCSCLRRAHRDRLRKIRPDVRFVHLQIDPETARDRVESRRDHFFDGGLIDSQFAALEEPVEALELDATRSPDALVGELVEWVGEIRTESAG